MKLTISRRTKIEGLKEEELEATVNSKEDYAKFQAMYKDDSNVYDIKA